MPSAGLTTIGRPAKVAECSQNVANDGWVPKKTGKEMIDQQKLREILGHLQYECNQLHDCAGLLTAWKPRKAELPNGVWSALVESFAVHARNLIEFLHREPRYKDSDVRAVDFVPGWKIDKSFMQTHYERAHKQVNHLTLDRLDYAPQEYEWPYVKMTEELVEEFAKLQRAADSQSPLKNLDLYRHAKPAVIPPLRSASQPNPGLLVFHSVTAKTTGQTGHKTSASTPGSVHHYGKTE